MSAQDRSGPESLLDIAFVRMSPDVGYVDVPTSSRKDALAGIAFYTACRGEAVRAQRAAWVATAALGTHALRGRAAPWKAPMSHEVWASLVARWRHVVGGFDSMAIAHPVASRPELRLLLLSQHEPRATVKLRSSATDLARHEVSVLAMMAESRPRSHRTPQVLGAGEVEGWSYLLLTPLPAKIHRPPDHPPLSGIVGEISVGLGRLDRLGSVPHHWQPMHGELAPWTLRRTADGALVLLDWEGAAWGPPGADEVFYRAAAAAIDGRPPGPTHVREAVDFWRRRVQEGRAPDRVAGAFAARFVEALGEMAAAPRE